ncbi:cation exchanger 3 [Artemisia annua]|uniref:Cation exchanger 3 n=1 Tax=Artemisia annua TaxID=35608 RepID=A0A2U1KJA9_ARTAN|nr:cation exchanger 3 [Artemisia annua]
MEDLYSYTGGFVVGQAEKLDENDDVNDDETPVNGLWSGIIWLIGMTAIISLLSEFLVDMIEKISSKLPFLQSASFHIREFRVAGLRFNFEGEESSGVRLPSQRKLGQQGCHWDCFTAEDRDDKVFQDYRCSGEKGSTIQDDGGDR